MTCFSRLHNLTKMMKMRWDSRLIEFVQDWNYLVRRDGWRSALPIVGQEMVSLPYRRLKFVVMARSLLEPLPQLDPKVTLEIREFKPTDLSQVWQLDRPSQAKLCSRRLNRGHRGLLAFYQGQLAGYAWGCADVDPTLERVPIVLNPGDMLCVDVYTAPAYRSRGVHTALTLARFKLFHELGFRRAIAYIDVCNYPSLAVWQKVGSQVVAHIDFSRIGPWRQHTIVDVAQPGAAVIRQPTSF
jgi:RimJ/RimL family protein N-acetyltransferase